MTIHDVWMQTLLDPGQPCPPGVTTWNGSDPAQRFTVYRNNVMVSLIDAIADTFPVVEQLVGTDFFRAMAWVFVQAHPPRSPQLVHYGQEFPEFIATFPPAAELPYLPDLARLERAYVAAFHAADAEPMAAAAWQALLATPELLTTVQFRFQPSLRVLRSEYAIASLWAVHQADSGLSLGALDPGCAENAWVIRRDWCVGILTMPDPDTSLLVALQAGQPFGAAVADTLSAAPDFDIGRFFELLFVEQLITGVVS